MRLFVKELGSDICPVGPSNRSIFSYHESSKIRRIFEWLEYGTPQLCREIDLSFAAILELQPNDVISDVTSFYDTVVHVLFQWFDSLQLFSSFRALPVLGQLGLMKMPPFTHERNCPLGHISMN